MQMPDTRGWLVIGLFVLTAFVLSLIALNPQLASIQLFSLLAQGIVVSGLIVAVGYYFGSSKSSSDKDAAISKQLDKGPTP